jgi:hypothetical protein
MNSLLLYGTLSLGLAVAITAWAVGNVYVFAAAILLLFIIKRLELP